MKEVVVFKGLGIQSHHVIPTANIDYITTNCRDGRVENGELGAAVYMKGGDVLWVEAPTNIDRFIEQLVSS